MLRFLFSTTKLIVFLLILICKIGVFSVHSRSKLFSIHFKFTIFIFIRYLFFLHTFQYETGFFPIETGEKIILLHTLIIFAAHSYLSVLNDLESLFGRHVVTCHFSRCERSGNCQTRGANRVGKRRSHELHRCANVHLARSRRGFVNVGWSGKRISFIWSDKPVRGTPCVVTRRGS